MQIDPHEITLRQSRSDVGSEFETRLAPAPDVIGETLIRQSTIASVRMLLEIRDLATEAVHQGKRGEHPALQKALGITDEMISERPGDVTGLVLVSGSERPDGYKIDLVRSVELYRDRKRVSLPLLLVPLQRMFLTIVFRSDDATTETVIGHSEVVGPRAVDEIKTTGFFPKLKLSPLAAGCTTCHMPIGPGEKPAVEETEQSADGSPRRWKCMRCVMAGLTAKTEDPEDPEKFDEATGPMP